MDKDKRILIEDNGDSQPNMGAYLSSPLHEEIAKGYGSLMREMGARYSCVLIE